MAENRAPLVPSYVKEPKVFYDRRRGLMLLGKWSDELWLFKHNIYQDCWESFRRATDDDVRAVTEVMRG